MTEWQYLLTQTREEAERGESGLVRIPEGGVVALAEYVTREGRWQPDDRPWRVKYQGSDYDFILISPEEAEHYLARWVELGRLEQYPDPASSFSAEERAAATANDERARAIWRGVEAPPGAESISIFDD